ncbi:hypothetical protein [Microbacterium aurum]
MASPPAGCAVEDIEPALADAAGVVEGAVPGLATLSRMALPRRELAASWLRGTTSATGSG